VIGLDTNVLIRLIVGDDARQTALARSHVAKAEAAEEPQYIGVIALCEIAWVLERGYGWPRRDVATALEALLGARNVTVEDASMARQAIEDYRLSGADFADALMGLRNQRAGCRATLTFDRRAAKLDAFSLLGRRGA